MLLNTEEVRKEVTVRESDTETLKTQAVFSPFKTVMGSFDITPQGKSFAYIWLIHTYSPHLTMSRSQFKTRVYEIDFSLG